MRFIFPFLVVTVFSCQSPATNKAVAVIQPGNGYNTRGVVEFFQKSDGVDIKVSLSGLNSNSQHGFHVHEFGDIRSSDGKSAGGHYNPDGNPHALPPEKNRHAGSFGNLVSNLNGVVDTLFFDNTISVSQKHNPIIGRSLVVHEKRDDGGQPTGNAGPRIGFGVIGIAKD